jgi:hypothetical protein
MKTSHSTQWCYWKKKISSIFYIHSWYRNAHIKFLSTKTVLLFATTHRYITCIRSHIHVCGT